MMLLGIVSLVIAAIVAGTLLYFAGKLTITALKKYKSKKNSKILAGFVKDIIKDAPTMHMDDLPDDEDIIIAEYDEEEDELVQDIQISEDNDDKISSILKQNGGIVVFD